MYAVTVVAALGVLGDRHRFSAMWEMVLQSLPEIDQLYATTFLAPTTSTGPSSDSSPSTFDIHRQNTYFRLLQYPFRC